MERERGRRKQMERKCEHTGECGRKQEDLAPTATVTSQTAAEGFAPSLSLLAIPCCAPHNFSNVRKSRPTVKH